MDEEKLEELEDEFEDWVNLFKEGGCKEIDKYKVYCVVGGKLWNLKLDEKAGEIQIREVNMVTRK